MNEAKDFGGLLSAMYEALSDDIAPLKISVFKSREPLAFGDRLDGQCSAAAEGEAWGERLFDCAWMRFDVEIPGDESLAGLALKIDINGELFIADDSGSPVCGLTCKSSNFCDVLGKPGKTFYELPETLARKRKFSVWTDCGLNDLFGNIKGGGKIACARLVRLNPEMRRLMHDFEFAHSWAFDRGCPGEIRKALDAAVGRVAELLEEDLRGNASAAAQILEAAIFSEAERPALEVSAIGHAHMDLAWLWPVRETKRKLARTFATALMLGEKYPDYLYGASQPQAYAWMKEEYPQLYGRIKKAVSEGRIEPLGCMWVEPDCNLPSGESFVRQILHGRKFFAEEFGVSPDHFWIPDSFGYSPQLPQILLKSGVKYFVTQKISWNMINRFPYHSFRWEGIDGSRVLAHMLPEETYNSPALPRSVMKIAEEYAQRDMSANALMAFGIGDGGGGPGIEHLERIERNARASGLPKIVQRTVSEFLKRLEAESGSFPVWCGDLYLEKHQGTFTTQGLNKYYNRRCECLLKEAEFLMFMLETEGGERLDKSFLDAIWKEVLLYQFHDILPGSSIKRVYDESQARYRKIIESLERYTLDAAEKLCAITGYDAFYCSSHMPESGFEIRGSIADAPEDEWEAALGGVLENGHIRAEFDSCGRLVSLKRKGCETEYVSGSDPENGLLVYEDNGDAWDFGYEYRQKAPEKMRLSASFFSRASNALRLEFEYGNSRLAQTVRLRGDRLLFETDLDWRDRRRMLRARYPLGFKALKSRSEVAFGSYEREVDDAGEWRRARIETPAHQWVNMQGGSDGLAMLNDGKYGYRLKDNSIEVNLLRCVPCPGSPLVSASDKSEDSVPDDSRDFADIGRQSFKYSLYPHAEFDAAGLAKRARALNHPLIAPGAGRPSSVCPMPRFADSDMIETAWIKPAENGRGWIARLVNLCGSEVEAAPLFGGFEGRVAEVDLSEKILGRPDGGKLRFGPHEIRSFLLEYKF